MEQSNGKNGKVSIPYSLFGTIVVTLTVIVTQWIFISTSMARLDQKLDDTNNMMIQEIKHERELQLQREQQQQQRYDELFQQQREQNAWLEKMRDQINSIQYTRKGR